MEIFFIFWFVSAVTIIIGGPIILAIYKGYCESKNRHLSYSDEDTILGIIFMLAMLPITLFVLALIGLCHLPYLIGKLLGKYL